MLRARRAVSAAQSQLISSSSAEVGFSVSQVFWRELSIGDGRKPCSKQHGLPQSGERRTAWIHSCSALVCNLETEPQGKLLHPWHGQCFTEDAQSSAVG